MANVKDAFNGAISEAMKAADLLTDNKDRAMAFAAIASALAQTGLVDNASVDSVKKEEKKEEAPKKEKRHSDSLKRSVKKIEADDEKVEEEAPAEAEEKPEIPKKEFEPLNPDPKKKIEEAKEGWTEEWTDEAVEHFADQLQYLEDFSDKYGVEATNECLKEFSSGVMKDIASDVSPLNIDSVVTAFKAFVDETDKAEAEA